MLQWSRNHRLRLAFTAALVVAGLTCIIDPASLASQEQPTEAVLVSGPTPAKGIPVYAPNEISAFRGVYSLEAATDQGAETQSADEEARILTILYTRQDLLVPRSWVTRRCGAWRVYQVPDYESFTLCYQDERGFFLFFFFPEIQEPAYWCSVTDPFIERFLFLFNFISSETEVPFPAILQVGQ